MTNFQSHQSIHLMGWPSLLPETYVPVTSICGQIHSASPPRESTSIILLTLSFFFVVLPLAVCSVGRGEVYQFLRTVEAQPSRVRSANTQPISDITSNRSRKPRVCRLQHYSADSCTLHPDRQFLRGFRFHFHRHRSLSLIQLSQRTQDQRIETQPVRLQHPANPTRTCRAREYERFHSLFCCGWLRWTASATEAFSRVNLSKRLRNAG